MKAAQFNDVWMYCASTEMVEVYEDAMQEVDPEYLEESDIRSYLLVMADLRDLARSKVRLFVCGDHVMRRRRAAAMVQSERFSEVSDRPASTQTIDVFLHSWIRSACSSI
jgi:hypothetical protein